MPDIAQTSAGLVSPLTLNAAPLVDLSSDKVTIPLRQWPKRPHHNGSGFPPIVFTFTRASLEEYAA